MDSKPVRAFLLATLILEIIGWLGLYAVLLYTSPSGGTRWAAFFFAVIALTGLALPVASFLNQRFPSTPPVTSGIITRQAIWFGIYLPTLAWLQISGVFSLPLALLLAAGLILVELLLRLRERSQWKP
jgi:hypothetical protein